MTCAKLTVWILLCTAQLSLANILSSNRVDGLFVDSLRAYVFHQSSEGLSLSQLQFNSQFKIDSSQIHTYEGLKVFPPNWPRIDSAAQARWSILALDNQLIIPKRNAAGYFNGFLILNKSDLGAHVREFDFKSEDEDIYPPSKFIVEGSSASFVIGTDEVYEIQIESGSWRLVGDSLAPLKVKTWVDGSLVDGEDCVSGVSCSVNQDIQIWDLNSDFLAAQNGLYQFNGVKFDKLHEGSFTHLLRDSRAISWMDSKSTIVQSITNSPLEVGLWSGNPTWSELVDRAHIQSAEFDGSTWSVGVSLDGQSRGLVNFNQSEVLPPSSDSINKFQDAMYQFEQGITPQNVELSGVGVLRSNNQRALVISSFGFGLSLTQDPSKGWEYIYNQTQVRGGLQEVRIIPSVLTDVGETVQIAYRLSQDSYVDIEVFNYNMERVKIVQERVWRQADPIRSSDPREDVWDGTNDQGQSVSPGPYYIQVKDQRGRKSWSKVLKLSGPSS